ncbi:MAG TPA: carboxymuconolactone decarboxylase family protein [Longimicrobiaceae bacterium]|nr:carboxymuconolactone decarboxylase family protein [Longimicrobiaceae bacterium]
MRLDAAREALVALSAALATRDEATVREAVRRAAAEADPDAAEEVLLQSHLFVGFPDALSALALWREASGRPAPEPLGEACEGWTGRGERVCARVYGANYPKLRANVVAVQPEMDRWMVEGGYGRVIGRPGLDLATRELCIAALLAVWNTPRQLHSHLRGALNAGAPAGEVDAAVETACGFLGAEAAGRVRALWGEVRERVARTPHPEENDTTVA